MTSNEGAPGFSPAQESEDPSQTPRRLVAEALGPFYPKRAVRPLVDTTPITPPEQNIPPEI